MCQPTKPDEELYDIENEPHEINNLAADPAYAEIINEHRTVLERWMEKSGDMGLQPENI